MQNNWTRTSKTIGGKCCISDILLCSEDTAVVEFGSRVVQVSLSTAAATLKSLSRHFNFDRQSKLLVDKKWVCKTGTKWTRSLCLCVCVCAHLNMHMHVSYNLKRTLRPDETLRKGQHYMLRDVSLMDQQSRYIKNRNIVA